MAREEASAEERFRPMRSDDLRLPDFAVIGGSRCGTQWLRACLVEHPQAYVTPDVHEIFFFDRYFDRGINWYARLFRGYSGQRRVGDISPTYLAHPQAPRRLRDVLPDATLLVSLRDPVQRAWSRYRQMRWKGTIDPHLGFRQACETVPGIIGDGEYFRHLQSWTRLFPAEQLHYLILEDAKADPFAHLRRVYEILGVDPEFRAVSTTEKVNEDQTPRSLLLSKAAFRAWRLLHHNKRLHADLLANRLARRLGLKRLVFKEGRDPGRDPSPPSTADRAWLAAHYQDDVSALSELTGRDLVGLWLDKYGVAASGRPAAG
jgi:Sulfotransferase domain